MTDALWHAVVIINFLLVGVPSNVAVLWIHTRKNSRVAKNRFPLIFAVLDLLALVTSLPFLQYAFEKREREAYDVMYLNASFVFILNGYLVTLFMATIDKFYAVMFPFKYINWRATIFKTTIFITLIVNTALGVTLATIVGTLGRQTVLVVNGFYSVMTLLTFIAICVAYLIIIAKLIRNHRYISRVKDRG